MKNNKYIIIAFFSLSLFTSCLDDLDTEPVVEETIDNIISNDPDAINGALAKLYASLSLHGQGAPEGGDQLNDLVGADSGESPLLRGYWNMQEVTTDLVKNRWGDNGLDPLTTTSGWTPDNKFFTYTYDRINFTAISCNNFINEMNRLNPENKTQYISEARFLRALVYYMAMDMFGTYGLLTENDPVGGAVPQQSSRADLFNFVESELLEIESLLPVNSSTSYGRATQSAAQMLLAKIYLNAEIYTNQNRYTDCITQLDKVIGQGGYTLEENYIKNFSGDNHTSTEIIFPLIADKTTTQGFGNTTYIINGSYKPVATNVEYGVTADATGAWEGHHCSPALYSLFGDLSTTKDNRAQFQTEGYEYEMTDYRDFTNGYPTTKFRNSLSTGEQNITRFADTDFPFFRLSDAYLMYAEAVLRGGGGNDQTALDYVNKLRERAYGDTSGNITSSDLTLDFLIQERARELYYEGHRRQDLIRFGMFTGGNYLWPWKGNTLEGASISSDYKLFPIPNTALDANPNLTQNSGY